MAAKAGKRPLRSLTATEKLEAIRRVHDGESKASVARDIGVPESTLRGWCKNEDKISYLSRQSSPETDESLDHSNTTKRAKLEEPAMQPFNLSLKSSGGTYSPNTSADYMKNDAETPKMSLNLSTKIETPKPTNQMGERERNRAELARLSVELGLNRPEMFIPSMNNSTNNLTELANISLLAAQWNNLFLQQQQQQQKSQQQQVTKNKITAPADTSTHMVPSATGLLTTVDQDKAKHLPKERQSVHDSVWYWLKTQQTMMGLQHQNPLSNVQNMNGISTSATTPTTSSSSMASTNMLNALNGVSSDQSKWFWSWYKDLTYVPQGHQQTQGPPPAGNRPILYQQLTKDSPSKDTTDSDPQNAENLSVNEKEKCVNKIVNSTTNMNGNNRARSVLDNLLFNNNNNVAVNKRDGKDVEESISQSEAVEHGEKFLKWLEACSDPSVTAMQIMQFRTLLNNVKAGADRRNGDLQNKTKVKRK